MDRNTIKRYFETHSNRNVGIEFPEPKPPKAVQQFAEGNTVIVTTYCEDIGLHELTGTVHSISNRTGSIIVKLDVDGTLLPFRAHELGHRY